MYKKLKRTRTHGYLEYIPRFRETFPELKKVDSEELAVRLRELRLDFYCEEPTPVNVWMRLTLPFAILTMIVMFIFLPFNFLFTGVWGYSIDNPRLLNWFRALGLQ